jgi:signal transduction histidine kinase
MHLIDDTIKNVRRLSSELRPGILDDMGLTAALEWQSQEFEKKSGIKVTYTELSNVEVDKSQSIGLYRIFQELLTNIARHAEPTEVVWSLSIENDYIVLALSDNGKGFSPELPNVKLSLGILGMKERTLAMNGMFHLDSAPGKGTRVRVEVPIMVHGDQPSEKG